MQPIFDPRHNFREIAKHLILLENHLCNPERRCADCIAKHLLSVEAYADEAAELDKQGKYHKTAYELSLLARKTWDLVFLYQADFRQIQQWVRIHRKRLCSALRPVLVPKNIR
jgi:hypothetical protein